VTGEARRDPVGATSEGDTTDGFVSIRRLKQLVLSRCTEDDPLRAVVLAEKDQLTPAEFLAKMEVWCVLLNRSS